MHEFPSKTLRNTRKIFVKCVDCGCQTLPQNASKERPWVASASLYINGAANDGALCFNCANKRRETLGLPVERAHSETVRPSPACDTKRKRVRINTHDYCWEISNLESLLKKWRDASAGSSFRNRDMKFWLVAVNDEVIPATMFSAIPISDEDNIFIAMGAVAGG